MQQNDHFICIEAVFDNKIGFCLPTYIITLEIVDEHSYAYTVHVCLRKTYIPITILNVQGAIGGHLIYFWLSSVNSIFFIYLFDTLWTF